MLERLNKQIEFIVEIDKLKHIFRKSKPIGSDRFENDAEHTWHLTVMAVLLSEHANEPHLNLMKVVKMLLIHDIVEIDAGDTFLYDERGNSDKAQREELAAARLFGILPADQMEECLALWREFEARETSEARFAAALDRLHPILLNVHNKGQSWRENGISADRVRARCQHMAEGSATLWEYADEMLQRAIESGYLKREENPREDSL